MPLLIIEPRPVPSLGLVESVGDSLSWNGREYLRVSSPEDRPVFYDWLRNSMGEIVGLELHLFPDDEAWLGSLPRDLPNPTADFPRLLFCDEEAPQPSGLEAFGDIYFYRCAPNQWLVVVGIDQWLTGADTTRLEGLAASSPQSRPSTT